MFPNALTGLAPIIDATTEILILGSFPGEASLKAAQYYAHPRNQFWPLLAAALNEPLVEMDYAERVARLQARHIGLWDVIGSCARTGSLDSAIRNAQANDFTELKLTAPHLRRVCFNGKTAARFEAAFRTKGYEAITLPSSSPANAQLSFETKLSTWRNIVG